SLEELACRRAALVAEVRDEKVGHLPAVARLFRHVAREADAVMLGRRAIEEFARLLDRAHLRIALPDDEAEELVLDFACGDVADAFPPAVAGVAAEADLRGYVGGEFLGQRDLRIRGDIDA